MPTSAKATMVKAKKQGYWHRAKQKDAKIKAKAVLTEALGIGSKASGPAPSTPKRAVEAPGTPKGESPATAEKVGTPVGGTFPPPLPKLPWMVVGGSKAAEAAEAATLAEKADEQSDSEVSATSKEGQGLNGKKGKKGKGKGKGKSKGKKGSGSKGKKGKQKGAWKGNAVKKGQKS